MSAAFDIIFAGGGTAACVIAGRLATADPSLKILVIESGQHSRDVPRHVQPCKSIENIAPGSTSLSFHVAKPSLHLNGRAIVVSCGKTVGGGSAVNFMEYVRGAASDYDDWNSFGNEGWSFDQLLPLFKKFETFTPILGKPTHGYSGPIGISSGGVEFSVASQFLDAARVYDPTRPLVNDYNDFKTPNAYSVSHKYIDPVTGRRSDAASRYLYPQVGNSNLEIMVGKRVKRVITENGRATGVEYTADGVGGELSVVRASKLVVVSAGAFGSPSILERSGIGAPSILEKTNIPVVVDLPGVGENYHDHLGIFPAYYASSETETMDDVWHDPQAIAAWLQEWERNGTGKIAHNGIGAMGKVRPTAAQLRTGGAALQSRWESFFERYPDKPLGMIGSYAGFPLNPSLSKSLARKLFATGAYILYPDSIGSVHIISGEDANSPLAFDPRYLSEPGDVAQLTILYKMIRELSRRMPSYRGELSSTHPEFPPGSPAACKEIDEPVPGDAPDIVYSEADDEAIAKYVRDTVFTTWHSLGTCAMKPRDQAGVVDSRLNVYGVEGLKVADLSICPSNVGNNTYSTALMIGEKAATIIAEDLGVKYV